jgi:hypothetical protein
MRKTMEVLSDRLLSVFVPKADVGAGCPPDPYYKGCYCRERTRYGKRCSTSPACVTTCSSTCVAYTTCT